MHPILEGMFTLLPYGYERSIAITYDSCLQTVGKYNYLAFGVVLVLYFHLCIHAVDVLGHRDDRYVTIMYYEYYPCWYKIPKHKYMQYMLLHIMLAFSVTCD